MMIMAEIFIVQIDEYDDQAIVGAFSTIEKATVAADNQNYRAIVFRYVIDVETTGQERAYTVSMYHNY
jgi:hypothetical protein